MSQTLWFRQALEVFYLMMQTEGAAQEELRLRYWALVENASTAGSFTKESLHAAISARGRVYRHLRLEGFSPEEAFHQAGQRPGPSAG